LSAIFTVSELTRSVKNLLEAEFPFVWVRGDVTNLSRPASGHLYFTLTDGDAAVSVVWFKSSQKSATPVTLGNETINPLTGEVEEEARATSLTGTTIDDGMEVLCAGRLNVYEPRGQYQLVAELVQDQGRGDLALAFEALKKALSAKGYFDDERKLELPSNPARVAVVTSPSGAAIRDFLRIANTRGTGSEIRIYPTLVQGENAPSQIAAALDLVDAEDWADVVVLIRGGGSLEDLWAFNTEPVADALFRMRLPVITGVGHEPDVSIADFVADKRAATPSHVAQELWPRRETLAQRLDDLDMNLTRLYTQWFLTKTTNFRHLRKALGWLSPERKLERMEDRFTTLLARLEDAGHDLIHDKNSDTKDLAWRLNRIYGPDHLERKKMGIVEQSTRLMRAFGPSVIQEKRRETALLAKQMHQAMTHFLDTAERRCEISTATLGGLDPEAPLQRGYSLIRVKKTGDFLRDPKEVTSGDALDIRVKEGHISAVVTNENTDSQENR